MSCVASHATRGAPTSHQEYPYALSKWDYEEVGSGDFLSQRFPQIGASRGVDKQQKFQKRFLQSKGLLQVYHACAPKQAEVEL
eukprot:4901164-Amphidinium_carterae.1